MYALYVPITTQTLRHEPYLEAIFLNFDVPVPVVGADGMEPVPAGVDAADVGTVATAPVVRVRPHTASAPV